MVSGKNDREAYLEHGEHIGIPELFDDSYVFLSPKKKSRIEKTNLANINSTSETGKSICSVTFQVPYPYLKFFIVMCFPALPQYKMSGMQFVDAAKFLTNFEAMAIAQGYGFQTVEDWLGLTNERIQC